jgi:streptomycin 3"-adenylyltransferase
MNCVLRGTGGILHLKQSMVSEPPAQMEGTLALLLQVLREDLVGAYLHGSAVLGGLRPHSDLDILVLSRRRLRPDETQRLVNGLLALSGGLHPRPPLLALEVTIVVQSDVRPWRYAPRMEFQFGEWLRSDLESGRRLDLGAEANADLAPILTVVLLGGRALLGPSPHEVMDPVPHGDLKRAITGQVEDLVQGLKDDTRHSVLTLARVWWTVVTGQIATKDAAAEWAVPQLPPEHRPVLERAVRIYRGDQEDTWSDLMHSVPAYGEYMAARIAEAASESQV